MAEEKSILETLATRDSEGGLVPLIKEGQLVALIENDLSKLPDQLRSAWLAVVKDVTPTDYYPPKTGYIPLKVCESNTNQSLVLMSNRLLLLNPSPEIIGRVGFHIPKVLEVRTSSVSTPQEIHVGEYDIKQAFEKYPELYVYSRLIEAFPK